VDQARAATGWELAVAADLRETLAPSDDELSHLRRLNATIDK
jgi:glutaconate CoA-transferase subunit B